MINKKNQRRSLVLLAMATIVAVQFSACRKDFQGCKDLMTEDVFITEKIKGIIVEGPWDVVVTQSDADNSVCLEYCVDEKDRISARLLPSGYLHLRITGTGNIGNKIYRAKVSASSLDKIEMSGAATLRTYEYFESSVNSIDISLTGASYLDGFLCHGWEGEYLHSYVNIALSGASKLRNLTFFGYGINARISGASELSLKNTSLLGYCEVDCSGASTFSTGVDGYAPFCSFTGSGASNFKTRNFESENLDIDLSGASIAEVTVNNTIKGRVTGASTLKYRKATNVDVLSQGASTVMRVN